MSSTILPHRIHKVLSIYKHTNKAQRFLSSPWPLHLARCSSTSELIAKTPCIYVGATSPKHWNWEAWSNELYKEINGTKKYKTDREKKWENLAKVPSLLWTIDMEENDNFLLFPVWLCIEWRFCQEDGMLFGSTRGRSLFKISVIRESFNIHDSKSWLPGHS